MRKINTVILLFLLLALIAASPSALMKGEAELNEKEFVIKSNVRFTTHDMLWNLTEEERAISLYMNTTWQIVYLINSSRTVAQIKTDEDENVIGVLNMPDAEAEQSAEYTVYYQVVTKPRNLSNINENAALTLSDIPQNLKADYLSNSGTWMKDNAMLQDLASSLRGSETNVLVVVENFVDWIWTNVDYGSHEVPSYPNETVSFKEGDCDDQAILLISLCRIVGIPAYLQIGCVYRSDIDNQSSTAWGGHVESVQNHIAWHGWAMVYVPPWGWLPFDLTYPVRGNLLSAVESAAVASQETIQYMNVVNSDYVTDAREYRTFLQTSNFHISAYDEIIPGAAPDPFSFFADSPVKYALVALLVGGILGCAAVVSLHARRVRNRNLESLRT